MFDCKNFDAIIVNEVVHHMLELAEFDSADGLPNDTVELGQSLN